MSVAPTDFDRCAIRDSAGVSDGARPFGFSERSGRHGVKNHDDFLLRAHGVVPALGLFRSFLL